MYYCITCMITYIGLHVRMCVYLCDLHISNNNCIDVYTLMYIKYDKICDRACENRPCECKLHRVIFSLISFVQNVVTQSVSCRREPIKFCSSDKDFVVVV